MNFILLKWQNLRKLLSPRMNIYIWYFTWKFCFSIKESIQTFSILWLRIRFWLRFCWWLMAKNLPTMQETQVHSMGQVDPLEKGDGYPLQYFLPGKFCGQRSLEGYSLWRCNESDTAEWLIFSLSLFTFSHIWKD